MKGSSALEVTCKRWIVMPSPFPLGGVGDVTDCCFYQLLLFSLADLLGVCCSVHQWFLTFSWHPMLLNGLWPMFVQCLWLMFLFPSFKIACFSLTDSFSFTFLLINTVFTGKTKGYKHAPIIFCINNLYRAHLDNKNTCQSNSFAIILKKIQIPKIWTNISFLLYVCPMDYTQDCYWLIFSIINDNSPN